MKNDWKIKRSGLRSKNLQRRLQAGVGMGFTNRLETDNPSDTRGPTQSNRGTNTRAVLSMSRGSVTRSSSEDACFFGKFPRTPIGRTTRTESSFENRKLWNENNGKDVLLQVRRKWTRSEKRTGGVPKTRHSDPNRTTCVTYAHASCVHIVVRIGSPFEWRNRYECYRCNRFFTSRRTIFVFER